jgi:hypothetical protein
MGDGNPHWITTEREGRKPMFSTDDQAYYLERAEMHDKLADATNDLPARKIHQAMAAEYRRKAKALGSGAGEASASSLEFDAAIR